MPVPVERPEEVTRNFSEKNGLSGLSGLMSIGNVPGPDSTGHQLRPVRVQQPSTNSLLEGAGRGLIQFGTGRVKIQVSPGASHGGPSGGVARPIQGELVDVT